MFDNVEKTIVAASAFPLLLCLAMVQVYPVFLAYSLIVAFLLIGVLWTYRRYCGFWHLQAEMIHQALFEAPVSATVKQ